MPLKRQNKKAADKSVFSNRQMPSDIEFCKKCSIILVPEKKGKSIILRCRKCGYKMSKAIKNIKIKEEVKKNKDVVILEKNASLMPITEKSCENEKCNNIKAYYWLQQTRSADEPPTQFFRCTKCKHVWREYK